MQAPGYVLVPETDGQSLRGPDGRVAFTYLTRKPAGSNLKANSACCFHPLNTPSGERLTDHAGITCAEPNAKSHETPP